MLADLHSALMPVVKKAGVGLDEWTQLGADCGRTRNSCRLLTQFQGLVAEAEQAKLRQKLLTRHHHAGRRCKELLTRANETMSELQDGDQPECRGEERPDRHDRAARSTDAMANEAEGPAGLVLQTQVSM